MTLPIDDYESEADYDSEAEDYEADYEANDDGDGEDARSDAIRRRRVARARRLQNQRRMSQVRAQTPATVATRPAPPTARQTVTAIRNLDLETKVGQDSLRAKIERANRRAARANYATVASVAIAQALDTFESDLASHNIVRAGLRAAPLLALSQERRRPGARGVLLDHRLLGGAAVASILAIDHFRNHRDRVHDIEIDTRAIDSSIGNGVLLAVAVDKNGNDTGVDVTWSPTNDGTFDLSKDGTFNVRQVASATSVKVTATAGDTSRTKFIRLTPPGNQVG